MDIPLLQDIVTIFGLAIAVVFICHRIRVPVLVGFLLTGILAGPHGLRLVEAAQEVENLAELGVVVLLFTIGIEFSLKSLLLIKRSVLLGGSLQVTLTILAVFFITRQVGRAPGEAIFMGFLLSLSSTAIVLKLIQEGAEVDSPYGRTSLAILIFQDIVVVPMMLFTPLLAGNAGNVSGSVFALVLKGMAIIVLVIVGARWVVPQVLYQIARTRSRELFLLSIVVICLGVAWLTSSAGLSLALGAFLAGLIISESEYGHQALGNILPLRDLFTSFFFVSIGMLLDVGVLFRQPGLVAWTAFGVLGLKSVITGLVVLLLGFPFRTAMLTGLTLSQVGEFSFILSRAGVEYALLPGNVYQLFLAVSVLTMAAAPFMIALAPRLAEVFLRLPLPRKLAMGFHSVSPVNNTNAREPLKDHLIVIGFGVNGRNLARAARVGGIPYIIIEMNPETVRREKAGGEPIYYGDATQEAVLHHADIEAARIVVVAISDPAGTRRITALARRFNPKIHLIARTRYLQEVQPLFELGADEVIPEEFETSVEIFTRVLAKYLIPRAEIEKFVAEVRAGGYEIFRSVLTEPVSFSDLKFHLPDVEISTLRVEEKSPLIGKSLAQIDLRKKYGVTLLAIRRASQILPNPQSNMPFCARDELFVLGSPDKIAEVMHLMRPAS